MERMILANRSSKNMPTPTSTKTHVRNIDNAAIFITQLGKKFGIMKLSMWMIHAMGPIHDNFIILVARMHVNNMTV